MREAMNDRKDLNLQNIRSKEFTKSFLGYDPEEVDGFLIEIGNAYQELLEELEKLKRKISENNSDELTEIARSRIEEIYQEAMEEKEQLEIQIRKIETEIEKLKLSRRRMYDRFRLTILEVVRVMQELHPADLKKGNKKFDNFDRGKKSVECPQHP